MNNVYGIIYGSLAEAAEELQKQIERDKFDIPRFCVAANLLFGEKLLSEWGSAEDSIECIKKALNDNMEVFRDADTNGLSFLARVIALGEAGAFINADGKKVLEIIWEEDGKMKMKMEPDSMETILRVMQISSLVYARCGESLNKYLEKGECELDNQIEKSAEYAGVDKSVLLRYLMTVSKRTLKSFDNVRASLQRIFDRYNDIKTEKANGQNGNTVIVDAVEATLNAVNIQLLSVNNEVRDLCDLLNEIASGWNGYSNIQKISIAKEIAGIGQIEDVLVLMENYPQDT